MATPFTDAVYRANLKWMCIFFTGFLSQFSNKATADISAQRYVLKGEMSYSFLRDGKEKHTEKRTCEIYRNGDKLKILTSLYNSNYPTTVFVCDSNNSFTYVQYADASDQKNKKSWNNADVWPSTYRMPKYILGKLTPLWLMVGGNEEFLRTKDGSWITVCGNGRFDFDLQPKTIPKTSSENFWPMGFSRYVETIEIQYPEGNVVQECNFRIQTWTNSSGSSFPQSFVSTIKKTNKATPALNSEIRYAFITTAIEAASESAFNTNAPISSRVLDRRPREQAQSANGFSYRSPDGTVYLDPLKEQKNGLTLRVIKSDAATPQFKLYKPDKAKRTFFTPLIIIFSVALFILLFFMKRLFSKSAKNR